MEVTTPLHSPLIGVTALLKLVLHLCVTHFSCIAKGEVWVGRHLRCPIIWLKLNQWVSFFPPLKKNKISLAIWLFLWIITELSDPTKQRLTTEMAQQLHITSHHYLTHQQWIDGNSQSKFIFAHFAQRETKVMTEDVRERKQEAEIEHSGSKSRAVFHLVNTLKYGVTRKCL